MSHRATNWAFQQRGLKPATWRVLVQLADRHNKDTGRCDPSQAQLAEDCEISISTLNVHLEILEGRGLIRRIRRSNKATGHQERTYYILGFDSDTPQAPTPETGDGKQPEPTPEIGVSRLRKSETNPVKEPGNTSAGAGARETADRLLQVAGPGLCDQGRRRLTAEVAVVQRWLDAGLDVEADMVPVVSKRTRLPRPGVIRTWEYFTAALHAHHARRLEQAARAKMAEKQPSAISGDESLVRLASWINSGARVPPSAVTNTQRAALVARGLVSDDRLRALQIY